MVSLSLVFELVSSIKLPTNLFEKGLVVNGHFIISPSIGTYNDTAASKAHDHKNLIQDLEACDLLGTPHSKCLPLYSLSAFDVADHLAARLNLRPKSFLNRNPNLDNLSPNQKQGLQLFASCNLTLHPETNDFPLQCATEAFNLIFFDGLIDTDILSLQWTDYTPDLGYRGLTIPVVLSKWPQDPRLRIEVVRRPRQSILDPAKVAQSYASVLLHEMTHAALMSYTCMGCRTEYSTSTVGMYGHGPAYQIIAAAIDHAAGPLVGDAFGVNAEGSNYRRKWNICPDYSKREDIKGIEMTIEWLTLLKKADSLFNGQSSLKKMIYNTLGPVVA